MEVVQRIITHDVSAEAIEGLEGADLRRVLNLMQMVRTRGPQRHRMLANILHFQLRNRFIGDNHIDTNFLERWLKKLIKKVHTWSHSCCI